MTQVQFHDAVCFNALSMFQPLPLFIGLRYVRSRQHKFFVSLITWVSLAGVALGVAALIVILSVMNGFEAELRDRLLALSAQAHVVDQGSVPRRRRAGSARAPAARCRVWSVSPPTWSSPHWRCIGRTWCRCCCAASIRRSSARHRRAARCWWRAARCAPARQQCRHPRARHRRSARRAQRRCDHAAGADRGANGTAGAAAAPVHGRRGLRGRARG